MISGENNTDKDHVCFSNVSDKMHVFVIQMVFIDINVIYCEKSVYFWRPLIR